MDQIMYRKITCTDKRMYVSLQVALSLQSSRWWNRMCTTTLSVLEEEQ